MINLTRIAEIITEIDELDLWDDRREYDVPQLEHCYQIPHKDAVLLHYNIQAQSNSDYNAYGKDETKLGEMIQEALHQGLDGWSEEHKVVINAFLADIALAVTQCEKPE